MRNVNWWNRFKKRFGIPNKPAALASELFLQSGQENEMTWEKWKKQAKKEYPIRYFFFEDLPRFLDRNYDRLIDHPIYWVKSFLIRKDHLLDLRGGPINFEDGKYQWGYLDPGNVIERAIVVSFYKYIDEINVNYGSINERIAFLEEELDKDSMYYNGDRSWLYHYYQVKDIYDFLNNDYQKLIENINTHLSTRNYTEYDLATKELEDRLEDILIRIVKIRKGAWT